MKIRTTVSFRVLALTFALALSACAKPEPLTRAIAEKVVQESMFKTEPVYAEVPQKIWWGPKAPKDAYDELAVKTVRNLERAGLVTVAESHTPEGSVYVSRVTKKGFPILGTSPSHRGPAFRGRICEKKLDGIKSFLRHPNNPTVGRAEIGWHYAAPTPLYPMFETKINKPLNKPFVSLVSFHWDKGAWHFNTIVKKSEAE